MESYLTGVLRFALRRSLLRTDQLSMLAGVVVPAIAQLRGRPMPDWAAGYVAWFIVIAIGGGVVLRFLTAPYFIWKEQRVRIGELETEIALPQQIERRALAESRAALKINLAHSLAALSAAATRFSPSPGLDLDPRTVESLIQSQNMVEHLSFDSELAEECTAFLFAWKEVVDAKREGSSTTDKLIKMRAIASSVFGNLHGV